MPGSIDVYVGGTPPSTNTGVRMTNGALLYPPVDLSATAYTLVVMGKLADDTGTKQLITSETSARSPRLALSRAGNPTTSNALANSISLYRHTTNDDEVWTTALSLLSTDGLFCLWLDKVNGGGTPANVRLYLGSVSSWTHKSGSPTVTNFQLDNGASVGSDGFTSMGSFGNTAEKLNGDDLFLEATFTSQVSAANANAVMAAKTTASLLALGPAQCYDYKDGMVADLSGHGLNRSSASGNSTGSTVSSSLWTPGA